MNSQKRKTKACPSCNTGTIFSDNLSPQPRTSAGLIVCSSCKLDDIYSQFFRSKNDNQDNV